MVIELLTAAAETASEVSTVSPETVGLHVSEKIEVSQHIDTIDDIKQEFAQLDQEQVEAGQHIETIDDIKQEFAQLDQEQSSMAGQGSGDIERIPCINESLEGTNHRHSAEYSANENTNTPNLTQKHLDELHNKSTRPDTINDDSTVLTDVNIDNLERRQDTVNENRENGKRREDEAREDIRNQYPEEEGYRVIEQASFRDSDCNIVKDEQTGESRRADFVVIKDGKIEGVIEVTSDTADKTGQSAKEDRIREQGGNYIKDPDTGELIKIPDSIQTTIDRRA